LNKSKLESTSKIALAVLLAFSLATPSWAEYRRSAKAKSQFKQLHPCPSTGHPKGSCPGYIIDHIKPLACGGPDTPENMQWQTKADAKAKDKWERKDCSL
jgi:hypothetical protein